MSSYKKAQRSAWLVLTVAAAILVCTVLAPSAFGVPSPQDEEAAPKFKDIHTAIEAMYLVKAQFYKPVSVAELMKAYFAKGTVPGMLEVLNDPYTRYMTPQDFQALKDDSAGIFGGIGILVGIRDDKITIISPITNTPGMRAGLMPGDHIVEIDGVSTEGMVLDRAVSMMRGEPGTVVRLLIERRYPAEKFEVEIVRDIIDAPATRGYIFDPDAGIGYIELRTFSQKAGQDIEEEVERLMDEGMRGLILDLRYNGGGLVTQAVEVASKFMPPGPVMHVRGRDGQKKSLYTVGRRVSQIPLVVLVNEYTASASEIVSGALQDTGVATIVGVPTFGKGLVQTLFPLSDGSGLAVTTQIYLTAGGREITPETPIMPDVKVEALTPEELEKAMNDQARNAERTGPVTAEDLMRIDPDLDPQFRRALEILRYQIEKDEPVKSAA
ncbi:MAG TPA: S41 family peptidase [Bacillota bacterium]|jgi:carboxyl-terminal processing protease|nr:S41 family peptidase [Bacillota bacterium]HOB41602.1 S41 family peptidase [Bacillota bacterium]HOK70670.1 S41 family peptidase [Bacillota bacterium]HOL50826.1 S41 family peptidase [Bacillota bacterium]HOO29439.1 S41 family peptidase [Bacillota bacterium]